MGDDASCAFNESISLELDGALDVAALEGALADLVSRHEALRSSFSEDGTLLLVSDSPPVALKHVDFSGMPVAAQEEALAAYLALEVETPFRPRPRPPVPHAPAPVRAPPSTSSSSRRTTSSAMAGPPASC